MTNQTQINGILVRISEISALHRSFQDRIIKSSRLEEALKNSETNN